MSVATLLSARVKFGENVNQPAVVIMNSTNYGKIVNEVLNLENSDKVLMDGVVGKVAGLQVVISDKLQSNEAYIVATGALGIEMKRDVMVEADRDIIAGVNVFTANQHYVAYLKDETKAVKVTISA